MKILFISDIVGQPGREIIQNNMPRLLTEEKPDFIIANAENSAGGKGLNGPIADELFTLGINVLTMGNHTFDRKEIESVITDEHVLRPLNYPPNVPGQGYGIYQTRAKENIAVISLMGRVYMPGTDCPFRCLNDVLEKIYLTTRNIFVDFHAEVTSEKLAMGVYLDGKVSAVIGTHTHVQTADAKILQNGTAYITDAGMSGPDEGIIGMDKEIVLKKFLTGIPQHFAVAKGRSVMQGVIVDIDSKSGKALSIKNFSIH
jgi:2',3'-cyclic-nucleotide 2'-phosphodiesterase